MMRSEFADSGQEPNLCLSLAQDLEVYGGPLKGGTPHFALATAVLFNRSPATANMTLHFKDLGLDVDASYVVRDLWKGQDLGAFRGAFTTPVASHGVAHVNLAAQKVRSGWDEVVIGAALLPAVWLGLRASRHLIPRIDGPRLRNIIVVVAGASAVMLLVRGLLNW